MSRPKPERLIAMRPGDKVAKAPPLPDKPLLTIEEAARAMGIGVAGLKSMIDAGTIYAVAVGITGKYRRVPVAEVEKWRSGSYSYQRLPSVDR